MNEDLFLDTSGLLGLFDMADSRHEADRQGGRGGVENKMLNEWQDCKWGDLATLEYGKGLRNYESNAGSYRVYGTNGAIGWHTKPLCEHAGVIVRRKGAYRGIHYSN